MDELIGKQFGAYQIVSKYGQGGMATIYKAYQPRMDRYVALKVLPRFHASDPEFLGRFEQEAKALAQLQHPHILPVYDYGESEGYTYFVMPLLQEGNLAEFLVKERFSLYRIQQIISQVGGALDFAHSRGFIHRDVKPSNILIDQSGNCMLMDFGIAKILEGSKEFTRTGGILGTPVYMSPEQGTGQKIDHRSDIYSLGIILYEMVTGRPPFEAETPVAVIFKHVHDPLPPPSSLIPDLFEDVEKVILKALVKNPDERYQTVREMVDALSKAVTASFHQESTLIQLPPTVVEVLPDNDPDALERKPAVEEIPLETQPERIPETEIQIKSQEKIRLSRLLLILSGAMLVVIVGVWLIGSGNLKSSTNNAASDDGTKTSDAASSTLPTSTPELGSLATARPPTERPLPTSPPSHTVTPDLPPTPEYVSVPTSEAAGEGYENVTILGFNLDTPPFDDVRVRQAIASAIDREALVEFYNSYWPGRSYIPATNYVPRDILGFDLYGVVGHLYDPELARQLLAEAGYPNGDGFPTITISYYPSENNQKSAVHIAEMLNDVLGIDVSTRGSEDPNEIITNTPGLFHYSWAVDIAIEPYTWLYISICGNFDNDYILSSEYQAQNRAIQETQDWTSRREHILELSNKVCQGGWDPHFNWNNAEYNSLLEDAYNEANVDSRKILYVRAEIILVEMDVVLIPLGHFKLE